MKKRIEVREEDDGVAVIIKESAELGMNVNYHFFDNKQPISELGNDLVDLLRSLGFSVNYEEEE